MPLSRRHVLDDNYGDYSVSVKVYNDNISLSVTSILAIKFI